MMIVTTGSHALCDRLVSLTEGSVWLKGRAKALISGSSGWVGLSPTFVVFCCCSSYGFLTLPEVAFVSSSLGF